MAQEVLVIMAVVIPDEPPEIRGKIRDLRGRELPGVPGSWVTRVAVHDPHPSVAATAAAAGVWEHPATRRSATDAAVATGARPEPHNAHGLSADELAHELDLDNGETTPDA